VGLTAEGVGDGEAVELQRLMSCGRYKAQEKSRVSWSNIHARTK
jgi:hypothetical protein